MPNPTNLQLSFQAIQKSYDVFSPRNSVIGHLWDAFKKQACCLKKSAVTGVDPCGGRESHPTRIRYKINKYVGGVLVSSRPILDTQDINFTAVIFE